LSDIVKYKICWKRRLVLAPEGLERPMNEHTTKMIPATSLMMQSLDKGRFSRAHATKEHQHFTVRPRLTFFAMMVADGGRRADHGVDTAYKIIGRDLEAHFTKHLTIKSSQVIWLF
jgi:hypothetical protein